MVSRNIGKYVFVWYSTTQKVEKLFVCAKVNCERIYYHHKHVYFQNIGKVSQEIKKNIKSSKMQSSSFLLEMNK